jgi:hypothetical protein
MRLRGSRSPSAPGSDANGDVENLPKLKLANHLNTVPSSVRIYVI